LRVDPYSAAAAAFLEKRVADKGLLQRGQACATSFAPSLAPDSPATSSKARAPQCEQCFAPRKIIPRQDGHATVCSCALQ
jgi:hypothetical protein